MTPQGERWLTVVGGAYRERCIDPYWDEVFGSGGRAATAIARLGGKATLFTRVDNSTKPSMENRALLEDFELSVEHTNLVSSFQYIHGLDVPRIETPVSDGCLSVDAERVLAFGMLECDVQASGTYVVYDPQSPTNPISYRATGAHADHLALVLNRREATRLLGDEDLTIEEIAQRLAENESAEVVVIKNGAAGATVWYNGESSPVPAYETPAVWKIGSGDQFSATFAHAWMLQGLPPVEAAQLASKAAAYYCEHAGASPTAEDLSDYQPTVHSPRGVPSSKCIYLAGPFFSLPQLWLVHEAFRDLRHLGFRVFSPYHDVGLGEARDVAEPDIEGIKKCDAILALGDGSDPGTIFEVGYARALGKPVVYLSQREPLEDLKMVEGSGCIVAHDYASAIYRIGWIVGAL